ncbi:MAG TPA: TonB-dependent receptor [Nitrospiria bacterium]
MSIDNEEKDRLLAELEHTALYNDLALLGSEDLVFSASKRVEATRAVPNAMTVISSGQVRALTGRYIPQILRLFPGLDVVQVTRTEFAVSLRGFANKSNFGTRDILVLVDGRTVYDEFSGNVVWESLDIFPEDVGKIEVIRGAGSAIHGPNASRGVINIITRPPEAHSAFESNTSFLKDGFRQRVGASLPMGSYHLKITGGTDQADVYNRFDGFSLPDDEGSDTWRVNTVLTKRLSRGAQLRLSGGSNTGNILLHRDPQTLAHTDQSTDHLQLEYEHPSLSVRSFWNFREVKFFDSLTGSQGATRNQHLYDLEFVHRILRFGRNELSWGGEARYIMVKADSVSSDVEQFNGALFFDEQYYLTQRFLIRLAGRMDFHEEVGLRFSPRGGLVYKINSEHTVKASVNMGYRNPTLANNFFDFSVGSFITLKGNPDLNPERAIWYETGYLGTFLPDLTVGLDLFYVIMDDLIISTFTPPSTVTFVNESNNIRGGGGELWAQYELSPFLRLIANYGYAAYQEDSNNVRGAAPHKINLGLLFDEWKRFTGAFTFHYVHRTTWPFETGDFPGTVTEADPYYTLNALIGYRVMKNVEARLEAYNITDNEHRELPEIGEEIPVEIVFILNFWL